MKNKKGVITKRQQEILQNLKDKKQVSVEILSRKLGVSPLTIRRDLEIFEKQGFVKKFYGGAALIEGAFSEDPSRPITDDNSQILNDENKDSRNVVAMEAAKLVADGDTIFINSSKTAVAILKYITNKRVCVITNNCNALSIEHDPLVSIVLTGGEVNEKKYALVGDFALSTIKNIQVDKCFIGVSGITADGRISTSILQETMINTLMIEHTKGEKIILGNHSRIGHLNNFIIATTNQITHIVTDSLADQAIVKQLEEQVKVIQAKV